MPAQDRKAVLERMAHLSGQRVRLWRQGGSENPPHPSPQEATLEMLGLIGILVYDWNAELQVAHDKLASTTSSLDVSTKGLDTATRALSTSTRVLIGATLLLFGATRYHALH